MSSQPPSAGDAAAPPPADGPADGPAGGSVGAVATEAAPVRGRRRPRGPGGTGSAGRGLSLSPSRAGDFMQCPLLYRYRVVDRLPEPPSAAAARGTVVHTVLEKLYDLPAAERTPGAATSMVGDAWAQLRAEEPEVEQLFAEDSAEKEWLDSAGVLLERYFELEDPTRLEPAERELYVEAQLESGLVLRGYVDRLDVSPAGDLRVVDYKTGRSPGEGFESKAAFQMRFYALVLWRTRGTVPRMLQLVYLADGQVLRFAPDESELLATERKLDALWQAVRRAGETGDWRPRKSKLCGWCSFQAICPEWGGTPPPLPTAAPATTAGAATAGPATAGAATAGPGPGREESPIAEASPVAGGADALAD